MTRFSRDQQPVRTVIVAVRVTPDEAKVIDRLAKRLKVDGRSGVFRAGLDALLASLDEARPDATGAKG